jgi:SulP family sulfate permease
VTYGFARFGRLIKYLPYQVVSGYLSGVAVIIADGQIPRWLGAPAGASLRETLASPWSWDPVSLAVGAVTIAVTAAAWRRAARVPAPIVGLLAGCAAYGLIALGRPELRTLADNARVIGTLGGGVGGVGALLGTVAGIGALGLVDLQRAVPPAFALSVLLSIDTLKTGVVLDTLTRSRHRSNKELVGQGVGNAVAAALGGMAGAGTLGPTLVNVSSGGRTPWSGAASGALALAAVLLLGGVVAWVPIAALAGILLVVAVRMFDWTVFSLLRHPETRLDFAVIALVVVTAESLGLIEASVLGVGLTIALFLREQARAPVILRREDLRTARSKTRRIKGARRWLAEHGDAALVVEVQGNLFFGTTDQLFTELEEDLERRRFILLDLRRVRSLDFTAGHVLRLMEERLESHGGRLLFAGMPSQLPTRQDVERYLERLGLVGGERGIPVFETRNAALEWMERRLLRPHGLLRKKQKRPLQLEEMELFRELDEDALAALRALAERRDLAEGEVLFEPDDVGDELYLIASGVIDVVIPLQNGQVHHMSTLARGDHVGVMAFLDGDRRQDRAVARVPTAVYAVSRKRFNEVAYADPVAATKVFARLALVVTQRLRVVTTELASHEER